MTACCATADDIYVRIMSLVTYGSIILMHVGAASQDANALDALIRDLSASGYSLGSVDQVIG